MTKYEITNIAPIFEKNYDDNQKEVYTELVQVTLTGIMHWKDLEELKKKTHSDWALDLEPSKDE